MPRLTVMTMVRCPRINKLIDVIKCQHGGVPSQGKSCEYYEGYRVLDGVLRCTYLEPLSIEKDRKEEISEMISSIMNKAEHALDSFYFVVFDKNGASVCGVGDPFQAIDVILSRIVEE